MQPRAPNEVFVCMQHSIVKSKNVSELISNFEDIQQSRVELVAINVKDRIQSVLKDARPEFRFNEVGTTREPASTVREENRQRMKRR